MSLHTLIASLPPAAQRRIFAITPRQLQSALGVFAAAGLTLLINKVLNRHTLRNSLKGRWNWRKEIVLVTGGSSGLGDLVARKLAKRIVKVVVVDISPPKTALPSNVWFYKLDVTSPEDIHRVANTIREEVGDPTVLVNNAGVGYANSVLDGDNTEVRRTFEVNILAHFYLVKEFVPSMVQNNHGHVVTVASMASFVTIAGNTDYSCTKAAALAFHEGLTQELRHWHKAPNVRTSVIHPTWVRTPMIEPMLRNPSFKDAVLESSDVADAIVAQVLGGKSGQVILPWSLSLAPALRGFPSWLQDSVRSSKADLLR